MRIVTEEFINNFVWERRGFAGMHFVPMGDAGDCKGFAYTVAYLEAGSFARLWWNILTLKTQFHHVRSVYGPHMVLLHDGLYIDNINKRRRVAIGFKRKFPWVSDPLTLGILMIAGKVFK